MRYGHGEEAVSTALGVIMLVAITLVLATVVGGLATSIGSQDDPVNAGVSFSKSGPTVTLNVVSADSVDRLEVKGFENASKVESSRWKAVDDGTIVLEGDDVGVGATARYKPGEAVEFGGRLTVVGYAEGGRETIRVRDVYEP